MAARPRWAEEPDDDADELHEINVTPFIDVMLVLLIVFMVAAPLATVTLPVNLPALGATTPPPDDDPIQLTLDADLTMTLGAEDIELAQLAAALNVLTQGDRDRRIFIQADRSVAYGHVAELLQRIRDAGYWQIALVGMESRDAAPEAAPSP
ncbi:MAG: biopolymer transporter ExbD [Devosia sp.]|uniref:biopolymer transporter ExbD n=1 Tax=Devosia sp. TaxID=1871048 RepID=UPI0024CD0F21|nr:biopolymer transporter ExbD [Devosia sp.]UYN99614.1 MAG: biopolymer transporter ExbD [Devosia sp.]